MTQFSFVLVVVGGVRSLPFSCLLGDIDESWWGSEQYNGKFEGKSSVREHFYFIIVVEGFVAMMLFGVGWDSFGVVKEKSVIV